MKVFKHIKDGNYGDAVDWFTTTTGIKQVVKYVNPDCGCEERRKQWNNEETVQEGEEGYSVEEGRGGWH